MKETGVQTIYGSPRMKVLEIKARQVLCESQDPQENGSQEYEREDW